MISCEKMYEILRENDLLYFTGVPDTILKEWLNYVNLNEDKFIHRIAANEGAAIAHAAGYYLSTDKIGIVYMQNSGLGNAVNPLISLADSEVFAIPMLLLIGWRGEPGKKSEPQHEKMGKVMLPFLESIGLTYKILDDQDAGRQISEAKKEAQEKLAPVALIVKGNFFEKCLIKNSKESNFQLTREEAIQTAADAISKDCFVVATTGKISRELFEYRQAKKQLCNRDFYVVGSMGHASAIAMEIACQKPEKKICLFDGDGALIMHAGTLATIGSYAPKNFLHILFDNQSYESTGGQLTVSDKIDIKGIALACKYLDAVICYTKEDILKSIESFKEGPAIIIVKVKSFSRKELGRPVNSPCENKKSFMEILKKINFR